LARTPRIHPRAIYSRPPPPGRPHPSRRLCLPVRRRSQTLASAAAVESPPPPPSRRRKAVQDLRLEVSNPPAPFVVVLGHRSAREISPEFPSRAAASSSRSAASPPLSPRLVALLLRALRVDVPRALNRAPEPEIEFASELCCRSPPAAAVGRSAPPPRRLQSTVAVRSRSNTPN
jgi:hypothetical protein